MNSSLPHLLQSIISIEDIRIERQLCQRTTLDKSSHDLKTVSIVSDSICMEIHKESFVFS